MTLSSSPFAVDSAPGRGARNDQDARAFDRRDRRHDRVPRILADQHRHRPKRVSKTPSLRPRERKRSSSKTPYVGKNILRCTCTMRSRAGSIVQVERAVVIRARRRSRRSRATMSTRDAPPRVAPCARRDRPRSRSRRKREIVDRALEKVSRQRRFGQNDQVRRIVAGELREGLADAAEVRRVLSPLRGLICTIATRSDASFITGDARCQFDLLVAGNLRPTAPHIPPPDRSRSRPASDADAESA